MIAENAAHCRELPETFGKWTVFQARFRRCSQAGVWEKHFHILAYTPDIEYVLTDSNIPKVDAISAVASVKLELPESDDYAESGSLN